MIVVWRHRLERIYFTIFVPLVLSYFILDFFNIHVNPLLHVACFIPVVINEVRDALSKQTEKILMEDDDD